MSDLVHLCAATDVRVGEALRIEVPGQPAIAVYNLGGEFFATDDLCTHGDASLADGEIDGDSVICPFHLGAFCIRTGEPTAAPCSDPLRTYPVERIGDDLYVELAA
jgi:nitrite reductase/ring-hydroxylating ferredoxin subunit